MFRTSHMRRVVPTLLALVVLGLGAQPASALFENTTANPASRAMGEASVAVVDPAYAALVNPAHLAGLDHVSGAASYVRPFGLSFADYYYLGAAVPVDVKYGNLGLAMTRFKVNYEDVDLLSETRLSASHGFTLYSDMHSTINFGYSLNLYQAEFAETVSGDDPGRDSAFGMDLGMLMVLHKRTRVGFQVHNLNNPDIGVDGEELARRLTAGISYEPYDGVVTTFEFDNELGQDLQYHGGLGFTVIDGFQLRAGLVTNPSKLTGGFGYTFENFALDYGFSTGGGTLESTHQFGLKFGWGGEAQ
jgi:hypothetical protein